MVNIKCDNCGGDVQTSVERPSQGVCDSCGAVIDLSGGSSEVSKRVTELLNKAARCQRLGNETEAIKIYRKILEEESIDRETEDMAIESINAIKYKLACGALNDAKESGSGSETEFDKLINAFQDLKDYKDSKELVKECKYQKALMFMKKADNASNVDIDEIEQKSEDYENAREVFIEVGDYRDSAILAEECNKKSVSTLRKSYLGWAILFAVLTIAVHFLDKGGLVQKFSDYLATGPGRGNGLLGGLFANIMIFISKYLSTACLIIAGILAFTAVCYFIMFLVSIIKPNTKI